MKKKKKAKQSWLLFLPELPLLSLCALKKYIYILGEYYCF